jgi:DNA invertase Pin-like site-specific DNA recombinase
VAVLCLRTGWKAYRYRFDTVAAFDRLGRSLQDLVGFLSELHAAGVDLFLHQQRIDTTTPAGKAMFQMIGVFAEFERAMIRERVNAGLARARAEGRKLGRAKIATKPEKVIRSDLALGDKGIRCYAKSAPEQSSASRLRW